MLGMALAFADAIKSKYVFVADIGKSFYFDTTHWKLDKSEAQLNKLVMDFALFLSKLAEQSTTGDDDTFADLANTLLSPGSWASFIKAYKACRFVEYAKLDSDGSQRDNLGLFNYLNGTLDLNTIEHRETRHSDYITKVSNVQYAPAAKCEEWDTFVDEIMCSDKELAKYLQKACGYALTADTRLECMFFLYGPKTRNGKSTFVDTLLNVFGDYGKSVQPATIAQRGTSNGSSPNSDVARLVGSRFVSISEPPAGFNMDGARVKQITGNDKITSRFLFGEFFEYTPNFKIFVNTNHLPSINDDTLFASGRIKVIPFNNHFDEDQQNKELKHLFRKPENLSAILNWLLEGLRLYKKEGLTEPQAVKDAIKDYRESSDLVSIFFSSRIEECTTPEKIKRGEFYAAYSAWCSENYMSTISRNDFYSVLKRKYKVVRDGKLGYCVEGYKLKE